MHCLGWCHIMTPDKPPKTHESSRSFSHILSHPVSWGRIFFGRQHKVQDVDGTVRRSSEYRGWNTTQLNGDFSIIQHKDPYKLICISWFMSRLWVFVERCSIVVVFGVSNFFRPLPSWSPHWDGKGNQISHLSSFSRQRVLKTSMPCKMQVWWAFCLKRVKMGVMFWKGGTGSV